MNNCSFEDCEKPVFVQKTTKGPLCNGHYAQYKKGKSLSPLRGYKPRNVIDGYNICPVSGCNRPAWHKNGFCQSHKKQIKSGEEPSSIREYKFQNGSECKIDNCNSPSKSQGYCSKHYRQEWGACHYPGCTRKMYNKRTGFCASHYNQFKDLEKTGVTSKEVQDNRMLKPIKSKKESE